MHRAGPTLVVLATAVSTMGVHAEPAGASRPFNHATLHHQSNDPALHNWLIIKTVTGPDEPRRMSARAAGVSAPAREIEGSRGRWIVNRRMSHGRALVRALRRELRESGLATLHTVGRYRCHATFRVYFRITAYNQKAPSRFEGANTCL